MFKINRLIVWITVVFCTPLFAQQLPQFSLMEAIADGLENNYSIILANNSAEISSNNATKGNAGMLPSVTLNGTVNGAVNKSTTLNGNVALDWTVFDGFAMFANYDRLKEMEMMGQENLRASVQQTVASIMNLYFDIVSRQYELEATGRILKISRLRTQSASDRLLGGRVSKVDLLSAQVDYNADTASYIRQTEDLRKTKIQLNKILAREITADFYASDSIIVDQTLVYGKIHDLALEENPDVMLSRMAVNVASFTLKATEGLQYPRIRLTSNYTLSNTQSATLNYGATLSMPLFSGFNISRQIKNARLEKESAEVRYDQIQKEIEAQVATAYSTYIVNRDLVNFEAANLILAAENLDISMDRYRFGAISAVELRDVQRSYISANNRLIVATFNAKIAETALKLLTGEVLKF